MVQERIDIVGLDAAILMAPRAGPDRPVTPRAHYRARTGEPLTSNISSSSVKVRLESPAQRLSSWSILWVRGGVVAAALLAMARDFCEALAAFDPEVLSGEDCAVLVEQLAVAEKTCGVVRARAAARAGECRAHQRRGFAEAADWLARVWGSSAGEARSALATAGALERCPQTKQALVRGELSLAQAEVIVGAEAHVPGAEAELLALAQRCDLARLKDEGRKRRLAAVDVEELHRRQHRARQWRHWRDDTGMVNMAGALPPEVGVSIVNRLEAETDRIRRAARSQGTDEPRVAHMADALVKLLSGQPAKARGTDLVVVCDLRAWRRGRAEEGEVCHVIGGGPVPVFGGQGPRCRCLPQGGGPRRGSD